MVRNSSRSLTSKRSQVEQVSNKLLAIVFLLLLVISIASAVARAYLIADERGFQNLLWIWPLTGGNSLQDNPYMAILTFLIGYNNLIPISLYMTTDLVRTMQAFVMESDESMYDKEANIACTVRSSGLCEDLGQVDFVLSDKTGTLTQNKMCFKACYIDGQIYGHWAEVPDDSEEVDDPAHESMCLGLLGHPSNRIERVPPRSVCLPLSPAMWQTDCDRDPMDLDGKPVPAEGSTLQNFFVCVATCHEAVPERKETQPASKMRKSDGSAQMRKSDGSSPDLEFAMQCDPGMVNLNLEADIQQRYQLLEDAHSTDFRSPSPDEEALLGMARDFGFFFQRKEGNKLTINIRGQEVTYIVLLVNEFSSERKRMSVLLYRSHDSSVSSPSVQAIDDILPGSGEFLLFGKGADSVMMERMTGRIHDEKTENDSFCAVPRSNAVSSEGIFSTGLRTFRGEMPLKPTGAPTAPKDPAPLLNLPDSPHGNISLKREHSDHSAPGRSGSASQSGGGVVSWTGRAFAQTESMLTSGSDRKLQKKLKVAKDQLRHFSQFGLRTLVCGCRELSDSEARYFMKEHKVAKTSLFNREENVAQVVDELERGFSLLGITAVEDKIQLGVPETVKMLLDGGIRVWMLTGDSVETAVNIAGVCRLVPQSCKVFYVTCEDDHGDRDQKEELAELTGKLRKILDSIMETEADNPKALSFSLVVNGMALYSILDESAGASSLKRLFATVACNSCSVIACRLAPAQKAALVELLQKEVPGSPLTLAVGDGGNDVSMIQKAHVGVGIYGAEGREAVNASDFAIGQFRFLRSLLFLHGRSNIRRIGMVIGYSFYKNFLLVICMACYAPWNGLSGTTLYDSYLIMMYNMIFTSLPIFIVGSLDLDVYAPAAFALPKLYLFGANHVYFNYRTLVAWLARGVLHALVNFFAAVFLLGGLGGHAAHFPDYLSLGTWSYWSCVLVANSTLLLHARVWMDWQILIVLISVMLFPPILFIYSSPSAANLFNPSFHDVAANLFQSLPGWLCLGLVIALSVLVELAMDAWRRVKQPDMITLVQQLQGKTGRFKDSKARRDTERPTARTPQLGDPDDISYRPAGSTSNLSAGLGRLVSNVSPFPVSPVSMSGLGSGLGAAMGTRTALDTQQKLGRLHQLYPATLANSIPFHYQQDSYEVVDYRAEAIELKQCQGWHPPVKRPGLRLLLEASLWLGEGGGPQTHASIASAKLKTLSFRHLGMMARWRARLSLWQWCQVILMFDDLDKEAPIEAAKCQGSDDVASKLSRKAGMQRELMHLDQLEEQRSDESHEDEERVQSRQQDSGGVRLYTTEFEYNLFTLQFRSKIHEEAFCGYWDEIIKNHFFVSVRLMTWVVVVGFQIAKLVAIIATPVRLVEGQDRDEGQEEKVNEILQSVLLIVGAILAYKLLLLPLRLKAFTAIHAYIATAACALIVVKHLYEYYTGVHGEVSDAILPLFLGAGVRMRFPVIIFVLCVHMLVLITYNTFLLNEDACTVGSGDAEISVCDTHFILRGEYSVIQFGVVLIVASSSYISERFARCNFAWGEKISSARSSDRDILKGMYPEDVVDAVRTSFRNNQGEKLDNSVSSTETIFQDRGIVTVVFIDIYDFGRVVAGLHPSDLVMMLDRVFAHMDKVCQEHGVVKIETVGKTFMFAGLGDGDEGNPSSKEMLQIRAVKCLETAWAILQQFSRYSLGMDGNLIKKLSLKIGINTGNVISGVVGSQKPQFALFGDTINTASRMMSTGEVDHIHVSAETYAMVNHNGNFTWSERQIFAKGKGMMTTYLLEEANPAAVTHRASVKRPSSMEDVSAEPEHQTRPWGIGVISLSFCKMPTSTRLREMIRNHWHFCAKVYQRDSKKGSQSKSLFTSMVLFWLCFCFESTCIVVGRTGQSAHDFDLLLKLRGGFALASLGLLLIVGLVIFCQLVSRPSRIHDVKESNPKRGRLESGTSYEEPGDPPEEEGPKASTAMSAATDDETSESPVEEVSNRQRRWLDSLVHTAFPISLVLGGYIIALVSNIVALAGGETTRIAHWLYYESIFYISAMVYVNIFQVSIVSSSSAVLMLGPATIAGIRADWPGGAIYPSTVLMLQLKVLQDLKRYQLQRGEDLRMVEKEHAECDSLLNSLLPKEVLLSMQSNNLKLAYTYRDMTMLFADIVGFTGYCNKHKDNPSDAVRLVTHLFASFDDCCKVLGAYKVCTIGDAYLAVNEPKTQHDDRILGALVLLHLAMAMLRIIVKVRDEVDHEGLNMRIGLHHGEFVAGVIGRNQLRFDIWGEDVLIGNQMESSGMPGRICCSATFVEVMKEFNEFSFTPHELIECAGSTRTLESFLLAEPHGIGTGRIESPRNTKRGKSFRHTSQRASKKG